jgi:FtsP/CotA-like multicopper oxidase with cupredoxin domain
MTINRRTLLQLGTATALSGSLPRMSSAQMSSAAGNAAAPAEGEPDYTIRIAGGLVELATDHIVSTKLYNGQFPGPLLRFKEGERVVVDIHNDTDTAEQLHWHGQTVPVDVDGAAEEGTPYIQAHGRRRISLVPGPSVLRFYHTHLTPGADLSNGQYSGQVGTVYIEPKREAGRRTRRNAHFGLTWRQIGPVFLRRTKPRGGPVTIMVRRCEAPSQTMRPVLWLILRDGRVAASGLKKPAGLPGLT